MYTGHFNPCSPSPTAPIRPPEGKRNERNRRRGSVSLSQLLRRKDEKERVSRQIKISLGSSLLLLLLGWLWLAAPLSFILSFLHFLFSLQELILQFVPFIFYKSFLSQRVGTAGREVCERGRNSVHGGGAGARRRAREETGSRREERWPGGMNEEGKEKEEEEKKRREKIKKKEKEKKEKI